MKAETITIYGYFGKDKQKLKAKKAKGYPAFKKFGLDFLAHRGVTPKTQRFWFVSEKTSGTVVNDKCLVDTMSEAIKQADLISDIKGERITLNAVKTATSFIIANL